MHCFPPFKSGSIRTPHSASSLSPMSPISLSPTLWLEVGIYLDCSGRYVPVQKRALYDVVTGALDDVVHVDLDTHDFKPPPPLPTSTVSPMPKGKGKKSFKPSSTHMTTRFATKASAPNTNVVGSPSIAPSAAPSLTPSAILVGPALAPSQSNISIPFMPRKRKAVALDTSATSSEIPRTLCLIENVDMGSSFRISWSPRFPLQLTAAFKNSLPRFVWCMFVFSIHSIEFHTSFFIYISLKVCCTGWSGPYSTQGQAKGLHWHWFALCKRAWNLRVPKISTSSSDVLVWNKWSTSCFESLFAIANANLHENDIIVFMHAADLDVSRSIHN